MSNRCIVSEHELPYLGHLPGPCPYLPGEQSNLRFVDGLRLGEDYRELLDEGYRRHGLMAYRPDCLRCRACTVCRVPVAGFKRSKSQRRVWNKGAAIFDIAAEPPRCTEEKMALYQAYLEFQHGKADEPITQARYRDFFVDSFLGASTFEVQLRMDGRLVGVGLVDQVKDALSTVYFYFHPDAAPYSPGVFSALAEIELAREWGLAYYYLGYYIANCKTMAYKTQYRPCELRTPGEAEWRSVT